MNKCMSIALSLTVVLSLAANVHATQPSKAGSMAQQVGYTTQAQTSSLIRVDLRRPQYIGFDFDQLAGRQPAYNNGVYVNNIHNGRLALRAGLRVGDIINSVNGATVRSIDDYDRAMFRARDAYAGGIRMVVHRGAGRGQEVLLSFNLRD